MVWVFTLSPDRVKSKTIKLVFVASPLSMLHLRRKSKDWSARNQNNVSEWSNMSTHGLLFQWATTIKIQLCMLVKYKADMIIISSNVTWDSWKIADLALKQQSFTHYTKLITWVAKLRTCCTSSWVSVGLFKNNFTMAVNNCNCT